MYCKDPLPYVISLYISAKRPNVGSEKKRLAANLAEKRVLTY